MLPEEKSELVKLKEEFGQFRQLVQMQLSSLGGGGSTRILDNDDVDISSLGNGKFLKYSSSDGKFIGAALTVTGAGIWALGQVLVKPLSKEINPLALVAWLAIFSGPILIGISALIDGNTINYLTEASLNHWMIAFYIGFIMQPITYGCFYYVLKNNPLYKVLPVVTMGIPPTGLLAAIFLLGEKPTSELFIGGGIIIIGVIMIVFTKKGKDRE